MRSRHISDGIRNPFWEDKGGREGEWVRRGTCMDLVWEQIGSVGELPSSYGKGTRLPNTGSENATVSKQHNLTPF